MLPGTNRSSDRFVRASFYIHAILQTADKDKPSQCAECDAQCLRSFGINTPEKLIFLLLAGVPFPIRRIKCITLNLL